MSEHMRVRITVARERLEGVVDGFVLSTNIVGCLNKGMISFAVASAPGPIGSS